MAGVKLLVSRKSIPGWLLAGPAAVLELIARLEGFIQFGQRIGLPGWRPPSFLLWALAGLGVFYLALLWRAEQLNEPVRQILRASAVPAVQNLGVVAREVGQILRSRGPSGELAYLALEDSLGSIESLMSATVAAFEHPSLLSRLCIRDGQRRFVAFLNAYERGVYRLRDAGLAVKFDFSANGNFREWKRFDSELLSSVRGLISQTRFSSIRRGLENSIWKDGVRNYL
jgi:hypothetical protein